MQNQQHSCNVCEGHGYYENVIVGGSETCPACEGTGNDEEE